MIQGHVAWKHPIQSDGSGNSRWQSMRKGTSFELSTVSYAVNVSAHAQKIHLRVDLNDSATPFFGHLSQQGGTRK